MNQKSYFILLYLIICAFSVNAQNINAGIVGINAGGNYYSGDLNKKPFSQLSYSVGGVYKHTINTRFALVGRFNYAKIKGQGLLYEGASEISFSNSLYELSPNIEFNFIPFLPGHKKYIYTPYVYAGISAAYYTYDHLPFLFGIPFGLGVKYNISEQFICGIDYSMRKTFTDKMDYYVVPTKGSQRQNNYFGNKDWYSVFGIYFAYKIKFRMKCPAFD